MAQSHQQPARQEQYSVGMPRDQDVYYDTVLETAMTVHKVEDDFVTYVVEEEVDNVHSDRTETFLAWLAAGRFIRIGRRDEQGTVKTNREELNQVFSDRYGTDLRDFDPFEVAAAVMEEEFGEPIEFDDRA